MELLLLELRIYITVSSEDICYWVETPGNSIYFLMPFNSNELKSKESSIVKKWWKREEEHSYPLPRFYFKNFIYFNIFRELLHSKEAANYESSDHQIVFVFKLLFSWIDDQGDFKLRWELERKTPIKLDWKDLCKSTWKHISILF